jgi:Ohr subfamily peroxiredoxin
MDTIKPLFTATATGGRNGHTEANDGSVHADLSVPKAMGGPGKPNTATPEHLFAAGYAACFGGALDYIAKQHKKDASNARVTADVSIGHATAVGSVLPCDLMSWTRVSRKRNWTRSLRKRMRKSVPIRTLLAETWTYGST